MIAVSDTHAAGTVLCERRGPVEWLIIDRPSRRNALNESVVRRLIAGVSEAIGDAAVRAIVVTGEGTSAFCAGADWTLPLKVRRSHFRRTILGISSSRFSSCLRNAAFQ